ncbi:MAG: methyltransferase domain-containing protein [Candidatus Solibacter sp.]
MRGCRLPLERDGSRLACGRAHSFDVARSGYINLLQPQDKRSRQPGDTDAAVAGRRRLHDSGATQPLLEAIGEVLALAADDAILDAGCGEGHYLGNLAGRAGCAASGVDISVAAIDAAARRYPACEWIVANADRFLPYADGAFSVVQSITARMNAGEFRRVLRDDGRLLVALPGVADLKELRGQGRDRIERTVAEFAPHFELESQRQATTSAELEASLVQDALHSIYRPMGVERAQAMRLTFSLDLLLFRPRQAHGRIRL